MSLWGGTYGGGGVLCVIVGGKGLGGLWGGGCELYGGAVCMSLGGGGLLGGVGVIWGWGACCVCGGGQQVLGPALYGGPH